MATTRQARTRLSPLRLAPRGSPPRRQPRHQARSVTIHNNINQQQDGPDSNHRAGPERSHRSQQVGQFSVGAHTRCSVPRRRDVNLVRHVDRPGSGNPSPGTRAREYGLGRTPACIPIFRHNLRMAATPTVVAVEFHDGSPPKELEQLAVEHPEEVSIVQASGFNAIDPSVTEVVLVLTPVVLRSITKIVQEHLGARRHVKVKLMASSSRG